MPKVVEGKRKRAFGPKTRSGCLTCKIRRVKCDEARPTCHRCTSTGRVCEGYLFNVQPPHSSPSSMVPVIIPGPSIDFHASRQEKRSFAFFVQRTSPQLAGFFASDFWERLVLQAAYHELAIRHAVIAIGSLHELFENQTAIRGANKVFALEHYNLAMGYLLVPLSRSGQRDVDVCLISCILFTCFENMQGRYTSAGFHIQSGAKLLCETVYDQRNKVIQHQVLGSKSHLDSYAPLEVLARIFVGLDSQVRSVIGSSKFKLYESNFSETTYDIAPSSFSSIEEAKNVFEYGRCLFSSSQATQPSCGPMHFPADIEVPIDYFASLLSKFLLSLQAFAESKGLSLTPKDDISIAVLRLHVLSAYVSLHVDYAHPNDRSSQDELMPQIKEMIALGERIVSYTSPGNGRRGQTTSFCLDMGIVIPLYTLTSQCRDPTIRRKAITLLRSMSRQEGLWNSLLVARAAERIMEIEESVLEEMKTCPDTATQLSVQPFFVLDGKGGRLRYVRQEQETNTQVNVVEELFIW